MRTLIVDSPPNHSMNVIDDFEGTGPRSKGVFAMFEGGYLMERPRHPSSIRQRLFLGDSRVYCFSKALSDCWLCCRESHQILSPHTTSRHVRKITEQSTTLSDHCRRQESPDDAQRNGRYKYQYDDEGRRGNVMEPHGIRTVVREIEMW